MNVRQKFFFLTAAILLVFFGEAADVFAADPVAPGQEVVIYQSEKDYPPFKYNDDYSMTGFDIDLSRLIFRPEDYNVQFSMDTWAKVYDRLKAGEIDTCGLLAITEDRKSEILYSKPVMQLHLAVYTRREIRTAQDTFTLDELKLLRVGVGTKQFSEGILRNKLGIKPYKTYDTVEEGLRAVKEGQIDALFENQEVGNYLLIKNGWKSSIEARLMNLFPLDNAYGVKKSNPKLVEYINTRLDELIKSGVYEELYERYFDSPSPNSVRKQQSTVIATAAVVALMLLVIFLFLQLYIRYLKKNLVNEKDLSKGILDNAKILLLVATLDGTVIIFNKFAEEATGYDSSYMIGKKLYDMLFDGDSAKQIRYMVRSSGENAHLNMESRVSCKDGHHIHAYWNINFLCDENGKALYIISTGVDISERKSTESKLLESYEELEATHEELVATEEELKQQYDDLNLRGEELKRSEERYRLAVEGVNDGIWDWDGKSGRVFMSSRCKAIVGYEGDSDTSLLEAWKGLVHEDDRERFLKSFGKYLEGNHKKHFQMDCRTKPRDGNFKWVRIRGKAIWDENGVPVRMAGSTTDITEQRQAEEKIHNMAYYDSLTGLPNRTLFTDRFSVAVANAQRKNRMVAIYFLDLDNFKTVNDTLGHSYGDRLLSNVGANLKAHIRKGDTIARLGGDEFIMMQSNIKDFGEVTQVASRLLEIFKEPWILDGREFYVTASIGISIYPEDGVDLQTLMKNADAAMYMAKEAGKNNFKLFTSDWNNRMIERLSMENSLRKALDRSELELHYQPQISLATGKTASVEALLRWNPPKLGTIYPETFIPLAEESGMIVQIGEWVLKTACRQIARWHSEGHTGLKISVNLSAKQFQQHGLLDFIKATLEETGARPEWLEFEITESVAMKDLEYSIMVLEKLREMGFGVSLDDFGTGYSSLNYLKRLPINNLKIDKSFVHDLTPDSSEAMIAKALIALAHSMELTVTAEGVETEEQLNFLVGEHCDFVQGFLFNKPMPENEIVIVK